MINKIYKFFWSRLGGRPWTFIMRDAYHKHPLIVVFATLGIGALLGHLFWGKDYIEGQREENDNADNGRTQ